MNLADRLTALVDAEPPVDGADFIDLVTRLDPQAELVLFDTSFAVWLSDGSRYTPPTRH